MKIYWLILIQIIFSFASSFANDSTAVNSNAFEISLPEYKDIRPKIALVLSGGGARSFAQIGVLEEMQNSKIDFDYIVGTSMGAVIGSLIASGYTPAELDSIINATNWNDVFTISDFVDRNDYFLDQKSINDRSLVAMRFKNFKFVMPEAFSFGSRVNIFLQNLLTHGIYHDFTNFNNLKYPFRAVATDVIKGQTVSLKSGNIVTAVRASSTIPLRFTPIRIDSLVLVDGGLMANIPTNEAKEFKPDIILAVNSTSPLLPGDDLDKPWNLADQVVTTMMLKFTDEQEKHANYLIEPKIGNHLNSDFGNLNSLILRGKEAFQEINDSLRIKCYNFSDSVLKTQFFNKLRQNGKKYSISCTGFEYYDSLSVVNYLHTYLTNNYAEQSNPFIKILNDPNNNRIKLLAHSDSIYYHIEVQMINNTSIKCIEPILLNNQELQDSLKIDINLHFKNRPFNTANQTEINEYILRFLRNHGYSLAFIDDKNYNKESQIYQVTVDLGKISDIKFEGNDYTKAWLIRREMTFVKGDYIDYGQISRSWENIVNTGLFSDVEILIKKNPKSGVDIITKVKEYANQTASLGFRFDNEKQLQGSIDLIYDNLFNFGTRSFYRSLFSNRKLLFQGGLEQSRFFNSSITFQLQGFYKKYINNIFSLQENSDQSYFEYHNVGKHYDESFGFLSSIGTQIEKSGKITLDFKYEKVRDYEDYNLKTKFKALNTIRFESIFDSENKRDFPTSGRVIQLSLETTLFPLSKDNSISFSKAYFNYITHYTTSIHTFTGSFTFGFADATLPYSEFFKLGGEDSFLGMREDEKMGRQLVHGHFDYRFKSPQAIIFDTYLSFAYDIGAVWQGPEQIKFRDLTHGIGTTLSLDTPIGPAKISVGKCFLFKDNTSFVSWGQTVAYFSIGMKF